MVIALIFVAISYRGESQDTVAAKSSEGMLNPPVNRAPAPAPSPELGKDPSPMDEEYVPSPKPSIEQPLLSDLYDEADKRYAAMLEQATPATVAETQQFAVLYACAHYFSDADFDAARVSFEDLLVNSTNPNEFSDTIALTCPETVLAYAELDKAGLLGESYPTPPVVPGAPSPDNPGKNASNPDA